MNLTSSTFGRIRVGVVRTAIGLCCLVFAAVISLGCEPGPPVDFVNETEQVVEVYQQREFVFELNPGETRGVNTRPKDWLPEITVISSDGTVLLDETITWEQVESMDHRIVITEPAKG